MPTNEEPPNAVVIQGGLHEEIFPPTMRILVETLEDLERSRIAMENRLRSLTQSGVSENGHKWGIGLAVDHPAAVQYKGMVDAIYDQEQAVIKQVEKSIKHSPLGDFIAEQKGLGAKTVARLLGCVGDPYWHMVEQRPRTVSELWAYSGLHVLPGDPKDPNSPRVAPKRSKGVQSNWNSDARKRAWIIAKSVEKQSGGKYRELYDATKAHHVGKVHAYKCPQCHAEAGQPLKPGHIQSRGLRRVAKEVLKDLWNESRVYHEQQANKSEVA